MNTHYRDNWNIEQNYVGFRVYSRHRICRINWYDVHKQQTDVDEAQLGSGQREI